jgi:hypothetical protein
MTIQYRLEKLGDGTYAESGTRVSPEELSRLMLEVRPFERRNDARVALETIDAVVMQQLMAQGLHELAAAWVGLTRSDGQGR